MICCITCLNTMRCMCRTPVKWILQINDLCQTILTEVRNSSPLQVLLTRVVNMCLHIGELTCLKCLSKQSN